MEKRSALLPNQYLIFAFALIACVLTAGICFGKGTAKGETATVYLAIGQSEIIVPDIDVNRIILPESKKEEIVDVKLLSPGKIYVTGKKAGTTNIELRNVHKEGKKDVIKDSRIYTVYVYSPDKKQLGREQKVRAGITEVSTRKLKEDIYRLLNEKDMNVYAAGDNIILSGTVSSASHLAQAVAIAEAVVSGDGKVVNLLEVSGIQQVMLEVRVSEISRALERRLGFNFSVLSRNGATFGFSLLNGLTSLTKLNTSGAGLSSFEGTISNHVNAIFGTGKNPSITSFIDALKEEGLLKVLAEPTLITVSGQKANFLAGGEFPVPVPQNTGGTNPTITIEWKKFGVELNFTPTVLSNNKISMMVAPSVSQLNFSNGVVLQGFTIPSLDKREVSTVVELADGQSFAIAGLLQDDMRSSIDKFPVLGDIPVLGALFRSTSYQNSETELVIIVTPHLVKPLDMAKQTLPTDQYVEPNDFEFYLMGRLEGSTKEPGPAAASPSAANKEGGMEGEFGHIIPK